MPRPTINSGGSTKRSTIWPAPRLNSIEPWSYKSAAIARRHSRPNRPPFLLHPFEVAPGLFVFQFLESRYGLFCFLHTMHPPVDDSQLVPSLLEGLGIGIRRNRALERPEGSRIISEFHLGATQVVIRLLKPRILFERRLDQGFSFSAVVAFHLQRPQLIQSDGVVWVDFDFSLERRFGLIHFPEHAVFRAQPFVQTRLIRSELDRGEVFRDGFFVAALFRLRLREHLMDAPGFRIRFQHPGIAFFGDQQMRAPAMIENIHVVWSELGGLVQGCGGFLRLLLAASSGCSLASSATPSHIQAFESDG